MQSHPLRDQYGSVSLKAGGIKQVAASPVLEAGLEEHPPAPAPHSPPSRAAKCSSTSVSTSTLTLTLQGLRTCKALARADPTAQQGQEHVPNPRSSGQDWGQQPMLPFLPSSLQAAEQEDSPCPSSSQPGSPPAGKVTAFTASITGRNRGDALLASFILFFQDRRKHETASYGLDSPARLCRSA